MNQTDINQIITYGGWEIAITIIGFFLIYHLSLLVILITGSHLTAVPILFISFFYSQILVQGIFIPYCERLYKTFYESELLTILKEYLSPILLYGKMAGVDTGLDVEQDPFILETKAFVFAVICVLVLLIIVYLLYKRRPAEACGKAFVYKYTGRIIQWLIVVPVGLFAGLLLSKLGGDSYMLPLCIAGILCASIIIHEAFEILFEFCFQKLFQKKIRLCLQIFCGVGIAAFLLLFRNSYNAYLPDAQKVEKFGIAIANLDVDSSYAQWMGADEITKERLKTCIISNNHKKEAYDWIQTQIGSEGNNDYTTDTIAFYLKDGRTIYRKYSLSSDLLDQFDPLYRTTDYKAGLYDMMHLAAPKDRDFYLSNGVETLKLSLSNEESEELLSLFQSELEQLGISDLKAELPISSLILKNDRSSYKAYVYPSFTKTIAFLEQRSIPVRKQISDYEISSVTIKVYKNQEKNYYGNSKKSLILQKTTEDSNTIEKIKSSFVYDRFANQPLLYPLNTSCEITAEIKSEGMQSSFEVPCYAMEDPTLQLK